MQNNNPHELTTDEIREHFLIHVRALIRYWRDVPEPEQDRLEGLAFSILTVLDGEAVALPKFIVAPDPHPDDKAYHQQRGENWYPDNDPDAIRGDIAGSLHEELFHNGKLTKA